MQVDKRGHGAYRRRWDTRVVRRGLLIVFPSGKLDVKDDRGGSKDGWEDANEDVLGYQAPGKDHRDA